MSDILNKIRSQFLNFEEKEWLNAEVIDRDECLIIGRNVNKAFPCFLIAEKLTASVKEAIDEFEPKRVIEASNFIKHVDLDYDINELLYPCSNEILELTDRNNVFVKSFPNVTVVVKRKLVKSDNSFDINLKVTVLRISHNSDGLWLEGDLCNDDIDYFVSLRLDTCVTSTPIVEYIDIVPRCSYDDNSDDLNLIVNFIKNEMNN